jgi:integrase
MPRKPEIGNVQIYPNRPLKRSDKNGYVLKFYCPIRCVRVRKNCGTRDRRDARRIQRECRERLLNGEYVASDGAITAGQPAVAKRLPASNQVGTTDEGKTWDECYDRYRQHRMTRVRAGSLADSMSRLQIVERILTGYFQDRGPTKGLLIRESCTLEALEYLQDRLLAGDESIYDSRSPNTVNSTMGAVMAFVRYCHQHEWIDRIPALDKLDVDDVMKGRPITASEFQQMLEATPKVVGPGATPSWQFALRVLWESAFRVGDLMDFSWDDDRHIHPVWPVRSTQHPTVMIPSSQKNGRSEEIPMLPGLQALLDAVPKRDRTGWVVNPPPIEYQLPAQGEWFQPTKADLQRLAERFSNESIASACGISEMTVRNWLADCGIRRRSEFHRDTGEIGRKEVASIRARAVRRDSYSAVRRVDRLTKERVGRVITLIGTEAGIVVRQANDETGRRVKYASAHDLRRGCAKRLIDAGISAETLMVVMRHKNFATTQRFYGASRAAQAAASEVHQRLSADAQKPALVGGLVGGLDSSPHLSADEVQKLKRILNSL